MEHIQDFVILDLFCGAGGFSYGMHKNAMFRTAVALDFNEQAAHTFKMNMPEVDYFMDTFIKSFKYTLDQQNL